MSGRAKEFGAFGRFGVLLVGACACLPGCYGFGQALGEAVEQMLKFMIGVSVFVGLMAAMLAVLLAKKRKAVAALPALVALALFGFAGHVWLDLAGPSSPTSPVVEVTPAHGHACLRFEDGRVGCVGNNLEGALGTGGVEAVRGVAFIAGLEGAARLLGGGGASCAQGADGELTCWGNIGEVVVAPRSFGRPHDVTVLGGAVWTKQGERWSAEPPSSAPAPPPGASELAFGADGECARYPDGSVSCRFGGVGEHEAVPFVANASGLAGTLSALCAVVAGGRVLCWDVWDVREHRRSEEPDPVEALPGLEGVVELVAGEQHFCARRAGGMVECWGYNAFGQLGAGERELHETPTPVVGLTDATGLHAGHHTTCATRRSGAVECWGLAVAGLPIQSERVETRREGAIAWVGPRACHPTPGVVRFD